MGRRGGPLWGAAWLDAGALRRAGSREAVAARPPPGVRRGWLLTRRHAPRRREKRRKGGDPSCVNSEPRVTSRGGADETIGKTASPGIVQRSETAVSWEPCGVVNSRANHGSPALARARRAPSTARGSRRGRTSPAKRLFRGVMRQGIVNPRANHGSPALASRPSPVPGSRHGRNPPMKRPFRWRHAARHREPTGAHGSPGLARARANAPAKASRGRG